MNHRGYSTVFLRVVAISLCFLVTAFPPVFAQDAPAAVEESAAVEANSATNVFDGRTDFCGTAGTPNVYVPIPTNIVHDVTLNNPRDEDNSSAKRVIFFNAWSQDEFTSPPVTKYQAYTFGFYAQENVNYESLIRYHRGRQYHYRARFDSPYVGRVDTFWVSAAAETEDPLSRVRADMYVSGRVGIGVTSPQTALHVENLTNDVELLLSAGDEPGLPSSPLLAFLRKDGNDFPLLKYALLLDSDDANKFKLQFDNTPSDTVPPATFLTVDTSGNVGIGAASTAAKLHVAGNITASGSITGATVLGAVYQDLAEWVPSSADLVPGTVVVLNLQASNQVMPSASAYDTAVAGVVSAQPGVLLGVGSAEKEMVATTGRVRVRVDATAAPIAVGDLLVTSTKPGMAMKSRPVDVGGVAMHRPGTLIGKALEPLPSGEGEILVLLSLQ